MSMVGLIEPEHLEVNQSKFVFLERMLSNFGPMRVPYL